MRQRSTVTDSRHQWKHQATQRGDRDRDRRTQIACISAERDRSTTALHASQARLRQLEAHLRQLEAHLRQLEAHLPGQVTQPKVEVVLGSLQRFVVARIGCRAVSRVLSLLAWALGIKQAPCPHTVINGVTRRARVRTASARMPKGLPVSQAPCTHGLLWMIDSSSGLGTGKIVAVLACDAHHHHRTPGALSLDRVHGLGVSVADAWTGDTIAALLDRLIARMGRPAASLTDGGSDLHKAVTILNAQGLPSPCIDDSSHAVAGMLKRTSQDHPTLGTFLAACGRVSGTLTHTILACLAPPKVHTKARVMHVHRLCTWADQVRGLSSAGGAKQGSAFATLRACLDALPACKALITRFRSDAHGLLECQKILKMKGLSHDTRGQCEPLIDPMPSCAFRQEFRASLAFERETAETLGLDHVGVPISADAIASLCGVAKLRGVGETQDANRMALRLPAFCGVPTREEAEQVLQVRVARQHEITAQCTSLTTQRREVLGHPERLERLSREQATSPVERIARPKNRSNDQAVIKISNSYEVCYGPPLRRPARLHFLDNAGPPGRRETALTSCIQKPVNECGPKMAFLDTLVIDCLRERGLELSEEKTQRTPIEDGCDFLGHNGRKYNGQFLTRPSKKNVKTCLTDIRKVIKDTKQATAYGLIATLNPTRRGWAHLHRHAAAKKTFVHVDTAIFKALWRWARRRHPKKGKQWVKDRYFGRFGSQNWRFFGKAQDQEGKTTQNWLCLASATPVTRYTKIKGDCNPYDPTWAISLEKRLGVKREKTLHGKRRLMSLWKEQGGICPVCTQPLTQGTGVA